MKLELCWPNQLSKRAGARPCGIFVYNQRFLTKLSQNGIQLGVLTIVPARGGVQPSDWWWSHGWGDWASERLLPDDMYNFGSIIYNKYKGTWHFLILRFLIIIWSVRIIVSCFLKVWNYIPIWIHCFFLSWKPKGMPQEAPAARGFRGSESSGECSPIGSCDCRTPWWAFSWPPSSHEKLWKCAPVPKWSYWICYTNFRVHALYGLVVCLSSDSGERRLVLTTCSVIVWYASMDWFEGKFAGNHGFFHEILEGVL
jgi:hypothetical protein